MKITTRIISGYGLFLAVLAGLVMYQVITIQKMRDISDSLSGINFQNVRASLRAWEVLRLVEDRTEKAFRLSDPDYLQQVHDHQKEFEANLGELQTKVSSSAERAEVKRLFQLWNTYVSDFRQLEQLLPQKGRVLPQNLQEDLNNLDTQIDSLYQAMLLSMDSISERARKTADTAVTVLWCATLAALAISILVSLLIVRSISKPLAHLTEGTRAIADGKFFYRLDTTRNDEFAQLAKDFNKMTSHLNELDVLKKGFVSHVSHELKAPLVSMRESIQLMLEEIPGPLTDKQKRLLELSLQSGIRLTTMIGNLLDLSKTEAGAMEYEMKSQDLVPLVRTAIEEIEVQAHERQIQVKADFPESPLILECDSDRIVQVVLNIVGNAVKFSPRNGEVQVRVDSVQEIPPGIPEHWKRMLTGSEKDGYFGLVTVSDKGPGIQDSDKEKIFEKFHQVKQGKKLPGQGVGLGLAICRTIIQAHRGAIWVEDNPGGGSKFKLLLRRGEESETSVPRASKPL